MMMTTQLLTILIAATSALTVDAFTLLRPHLSRGTPTIMSRIGTTPPKISSKLFQAKEDATTDTVETSADEEKVVAATEETDEGKNLMSKIKAAGAAGAISLFLWEAAFWAISIPVAILGYKTAAGSFPDFSNPEDMAKVGAEAFAFANVARFALPLRIGLAVSTTPWVQDNIVETPWVQENIVQRFFNKDKPAEENEKEE